MNGVSWVKAIAAHRFNGIMRESNRKNSPKALSEVRCQRLAVTSCSYRYTFVQLLTTSIRGADIQQSMRDKVPFAAYYVVQVNVHRFFLITASITWGNILKSVLLKLYSSSLESYL